MPKIDAYKVLPSASHWWGHIPMGPPDAILGLSETYKKDTDPMKVNLGVGAYRYDNGKPWVLPSVRKAEEMLHQQKLNHEYAPIAGNSLFNQSVAKLIFGGNCCALQDKSVATVQTLSGTGALRLGLEFIKRHYKVATPEIWMSIPTWGNHLQICKMLGLTIKRYRYFDKETKGFDFDGAVDDICQMPKGAIILLHATAHNPTGVDPKKGQWHALSEVIKEKKVYPFFDCAYQGFATGNVDNDAYSVRYFAEKGHQLILAQSFAKNMGLYGERVGALHMFCGSADHAAKVLSQLKIMIRTMYSNPPLFGSRIVSLILNDNDLYCEWLDNVATMANRIKQMRQLLRKGIEAQSKNKWEHITDQIGMFCFTGITSEQVSTMIKKHHIYMTKDGRISIAGITSKNVDHVAKSFVSVTS